MGNGFLNKPAALRRGVAGLAGAGFSKAVPLGRKVAAPSIAFSHGQYPRPPVHDARAPFSAGRAAFFAGVSGMSPGARKIGEAAAIASAVGAILAFPNVAHGAVFEALSHPAIANTDQRSVWKLIGIVMAAGFALAFAAYKVKTRPLLRTQDPSLLFRDPLQPDPTADSHMETAYRIFDSCRAEEAAERFTDAARAYRRAKNPVGTEIARALAKLARLRAAMRSLQSRAVFDPWHLASSIKLSPKDARSYELAGRALALQLPGLANSRLGEFLCNDVVVVNLSALEGTSRVQEAWHILYNEAFVAFRAALWGYARVGAEAAFARTHAVWNECVRFVYPGHHVELTGGAVETGSNYHIVPDVQTAAAGSGNLTAVAGPDNITQAFDSLGVAVPSPNALAQRPQVANLLGQLWAAASNGMGHDAREVLGRFPAVVRQMGHSERATALENLLRDFGAMPLEELPARVEEIMNAPAQPARKANAGPDIPREQKLEFPDADAKPKDGGESKKNGGPEVSKRVQKLELD